MQQPPWMAAAWAELGQAEQPGSASNRRILDYFRQIGHDEIAGDETAWCAAFVGACLEQAGLPSTRSLRARSYLDWGEAVASPALGTVAVLSRGADPALGHVGFLVGMTPSSVILLGGNQSDAVTVAAFDRRRVLAFRTAIAPAASNAATFEAALAHVLEMEGGWSDDPFDPGGPTCKGITIADLARERRVSVTAENFAALKAELRHLSDSAVRDIYLRRYWRPARCDDLPTPIAFMHFDAAVNQGVTGAARLLQEALRVEVDGEIGPITLGVAGACAIAPALEAYAAARRRRYRSLAQFWRFGRGWLRRVDVTLARALRTAAEPASSSTTPATEKPSMPDSQTNTPVSTGTEPETKWWGQSMTIWGVMLTALSTVLPVVGPIVGLDLTADLIEQLGRDLVLLAQAAGGLVGTILTILGRVRASTALARLPVRLKL